jgi:hypothetical protein
MHGFVAESGGRLPGLGIQLGVRGALARERGQGGVGE